MIKRQHEWLVHVRQSKYHIIKSMFNDQNCIEKKIAVAQKLAKEQKELTLTPEIN